MENLFATTTKGWTVFDPYYFSFYVTDQVHQSDLPGLLVSAPLKKGSRGRDGDLVILLLSLTGKTPYTPAELDGLLQRAALAYYKSSGSLTAGMRSAAEVCNSQLLERNLKSARDEGGQCIGRLSLGVLRGDTLFLAIAGPGHALMLGTQEVHDFYDPQAGRGLGTDSAVGLRYFQARIQTGEVLVLSPEPPAAWTQAALGGSPTLTMEHLRRRLLNGIGPNLQAAVLKFQTGSGEVHALRHRSTTSPTAPPMAHPPAPPSAVEAADAPPTYLSEAARTPAAPGDSGNLTSTPASRSAQLRARMPATPPANSAQPTVNLAKPPAAGAPTLPPLTRPALPPEPPARPVNQAAAFEAAKLARQRRAERKKNAAAAWDGWKSMSGRLGLAWHALMGRLTPQRASSNGVQPTGRVSPLLLVFIAIAVPLMVVAVALTVYLQSGRSEQRAVYYQQVIDFRLRALGETDALAKRNNWNQVLTWLDKAEAYGITEDTRAIRKQAQQGVDAGDVILRIEYKPISRVALANAVQVVKLISTANDIYALDASNGSVLRLFLTAQGYELDTLFNCGPGPLGSVFIGPLIDVVPMPVVNKYNASVAAIDNGGNLVYCIPGKPALVRTLAPPNVGWGKISRINLAQETLYVLDLLGNAIWQYKGADLAFQSPPRLFSETFNLSLADAIDFAMYEDYLYFLKKDGKLIQCTISRVPELPTRCVDPAKFSDNRPGREARPELMPGTHFTDLLSINAPDPSLYMLDETQTSIYRFSVVLNFQDQMRPSAATDTPLPKRASTAFTITQRRTVFMAYGSQIFMAQMP